MTKPVILTGLRANNDLHIGNYFGGLLPIIDMAKNKSDQYQINLFVPDLHSFTTPIDFSQLQTQIINNVKLFAAAGLPLDNDSVHIYRQSYVPAHSELTWILDCFTGFGEMSRMTQFKDKSGLQETRLLMHELKQALDVMKRGDTLLSRTAFEDIYNGLLVNEQASARVSIGLFNYPVLMAADILLYNATYVPVGDDQTQHLEFTRDIAKRINKQFDADIFTVPKSVKEQHEFFGKDQGLRIKDLADPSKKMSKSDESGKGVIFLTDEPEVARKKVMSATTDNLASVNYDHTNQPGISNLIDIHALLNDLSPIEAASKFVGETQYGTFKTVVAESVANFLTEFQQRLEQTDESQLLERLEYSESIMNKQANETLLKVQQAVGLRT